jgi:RimJ/RimL family protein N-acetyltransferase
MGSASAPEAIAFRPFRYPEDASALLSWAASPDELLQWAGPRFRFPLDEWQLEEYAEDVGEHRHLVSAVTCESGAVVGHVELRILREHDLGQVGRVAVAPAARGCGVATAMLDWLAARAFDELALHRLELVVFSFNEPARRCYSRIGFREEGLARHARKASNGYWDIVYMALLEEWYRGGEPEDRALAS